MSKKYRGYKLIPASQLVNKMNLPVSITDVVLTMSTLKTLKGDSKQIYNVSTKEDRTSFKVGTTGYSCANDDLILIEWASDDKKDLDIIFRTYEEVKPGKCILARLPNSNKHQNTLVVVTQKTPEDRSMICELGINKVSLDLYKQDRPLLVVRNKKAYIQMIERPVCEVSLT